MSNNNDEELEEIEEEEEEEQEEEIPKVDTPQPPPIIDPGPINNLSNVNARKQLNKKVMMVQFLVYYSENPTKTFDQVAKEVGISKELARKYLNNYAAVVLDAIQKDQYPEMVVVHFYDDRIPKEGRLTIRTIQHLNPVLLRYNDTNIEALIQQKYGNKEEEAEEVDTESDSPENVILNDLAATVPDAGRYKEFNEMKQQSHNRNVTTRTITVNSPIQEQIRFGIINCGQPDDAKIRKIISVFMSNPTYYLSDESVFVNLLEANKIDVKTVTAFMNWFKHVAPINPVERQGFLNTQYTPGASPYGAPPQKKKNAYDNFDINDYDEMAQYFYHQGIYQYGLPPDHPVNRDAYNDYLEEKKQEKLERQSTRQFNMALKQRVLEMQANRMSGGGMMGPQGQPMPQPNQSVALDEKYLLDKGIVVPQITYDMYGNKTIQYIPTGKTPGDVYGMGGAPQPKSEDALLNNITVMTRLIEALRPALGVGQAPPQNPIMDRFMEAAMNKLLGSANETPDAILKRELGLFETLQKLFPGANGGGRPKTDAEIQADITLKHMEQDERLAAENRQWQREELAYKKEMMKKQEEDSKSGIDMIMSGLWKGFEMLTNSPLVQNVIMGNMGGGLGNMLGGMMGGGAPPGGDMMGGGEPLIPPQPQEGVETFDSGSLVPPTSSVPAEFMPGPPQPEYIPQQPPIEQPYYEPPPQSEQFYAPSPPQYQYEPPQPNEDDFMESLTPDELGQLTVGQLDEISNRIETKQSKIERLLNNIKSTKVKKQYGAMPYHKKAVKTEVPPPTPAEVLSIPPKMNPYYDGSNEKTLVDSEEPVYIQPSDVQMTDFSNLDLNYNNDMQFIDDMGNDNQQFNQQNDANQPEFIERIAAQTKADLLAAENEKRKKQGLPPLNELPIDEATHKPTSEDALKAADNIAENTDKYNDNPGLDETKSHSSDEFNKEHKTGKGKDANEKKQYDSSDAVKDKEKKGTYSETAKDSANPKVK